MSTRAHFAAWALLWACAAAASADDAPPPERIVKFPDYEIYGTLYAYPWGREGDPKPTALGLATGEVRVPAGMELRLALRSRDVSVLALLKPGDLQGLEFEPESGVRKEDAHYIAALGELRALDASIGAIDDSNSDFLLKLTELRELTLQTQRIGDATAERIGRLAKLERLNLSHASITDAGAAHLAGLTKLRRLDLSETKIADAGLAQLTRLVHLEELDLAGDPIVGQALATLDSFPNLRRLSLSRTRIGDEWMSSLASLQRLERLDLGDTQIGDAGAFHLRGLARLRHLDLSNSRVTDAGLDTLAGLKSLQTLHLGSLPLTDAGLAKLGGLSELKELWLFCHTATALGVRALQAKLPGCEISHNFGDLRPFERPAPTGDGRGFDPAKPLPERTLRFPEGESIGQLSIRAWGAPAGSGGWKDLGPAKGQAKIPAGQEARLLVDWDRPGSAPLAGLRADDLQSIDVALGDEIDDKQMACLQGMSTLRELRLTGQPIFGSGIIYLRGLQSLEILSLAGAGIGNAALRNLADLPKLRSLDLSMTAAEDRGLAHLKNLPSLRRLDLTGAQVAGPGLGALADLPALEELWLDHSWGGAVQGSPHLKRLKSLKRLSLHGLAFREADLKELRAALPGCKIEGDDEGAPARAPIQAWANPGSADPTAEPAVPAHRRLLRFPERGVGWLAWSPRDENDPSHWFGRHSRSGELPARGDLVLPSRAEAAVRVFEEAGLDWIASMKPDDLQGLELAALPLDDASLSPLARLKGLRYLELEYRSQTAEGLAKLKTLTRLETLDLSLCDLDDAAVPALKEFKSLRLLIVNAIPDRFMGDGRGPLKRLISPAGRSEIQAALPKCSIMAEEPPVN